MAAITIEVPDDLLEQLAQLGESPEATLREHLPELLRQYLQQPALPAHVYRYILDFLASQPTPEQIAAFRPTLQMQERLQSLLAKSKTSELTLAEQRELDEYERIEHLVIMLKLGNLSSLTRQANP